MTIYCIKPLTRSSLKGFLHVWHITLIEYRSTSDSLLVSANSTKHVLENSRSTARGFGWLKNDFSRNGTLYLTPYEINCVGFKFRTSGKGTITFKYSEFHYICTCV